MLHIQMALCSIFKMEAAYTTANMLRIYCYFSILLLSTQAVRRLTIPSKNTHPVCKKNNIFHSDIVQDHSLKRGINPKNYTLLGQVPTMGDCMALCCATKHCNIAYMKNETCYGVTCYDAEKCSVGNATASFDSSGTQLALIIRNEMNRRVYVTAYLVVVVCAFGAAMAGTMWAVVIFYKRYSLVMPQKNKKQSSDEENCSDSQKPKSRMHY
ncbi:uncharacterized protein LOC130636066 [Hydractinia symbiolongicarpus]|uniref:uncharacterized protein LOC130636066 n=1 Tax=Hydractinia symbiolongicarpus TaxID=13093 RepID=UPI0025511CD5|nr:uncharacterized protein LOC130636066 [Hydractinia symbiolongicarpus]